MTVATIELETKKLMDVHTYKAKSSKRADQLYEVPEWYTNDDFYDHTGYFFIEDALIGRGVKASLSIAMMEGAVLSRLGQDYRASDVALVHVSKWKKGVLNNGGANKEMIKMWVKEHYPTYASLCGDDQDCYDACCIALFGCSVVEVSRSLSLTSSTE